MNLKINFTSDEAFLQIRLGRTEPEFDGSVVRTLCRDNVSVGVTKELEPVFVRINNAAADLPEIHARLESHGKLSQAEVNEAANFAIERMMALLERYAANFQKTLASKRDSFNRGNVECAC